MDTAARGYAARLLRYLLQDELHAYLGTTETYALSLFLARALVRPEGAAWEREQALKLIRAYLEMVRRNAALWAALLPPSVVRALAAVGMEHDDPLYEASIETLAEWAALEPALVARAHGLPPVWRALCEARAELAVPLTEHLLGLLDKPATRRYVQPGMDLEGVLAGFTDLPSHGPADRLRTTRRVMVRLLLSWQGVLYLSMREGAAFQALVAALYADDEVICAEVLGAVQQMMAHARVEREGADDVPPPPGLRAGEHYLALVLCLWQKAGLLDALVHLVEHAPRLRTQAGALLGDILHFEREVHPQSSAALHAFPTLVESVCLPAEPLTGLAAAAALAEIDKAEAKHEHVVWPTSTAAVLMDDVAFRGMLRDSMVTTTKELGMWQAPVIKELLEGPLLDPRRFDEALHGTKFVRRLVSFFRPSSARYAALRPGDAARRWTEVAVSLFTVLVAHADGLQLLAEDRFLSELADAWELAAQGAPESLFSETQWQHTAVRGYFDMVHVLATHTYGAELLVQARMWMPLLALCARDDGGATRILTAALDALDVAQPSPARAMLQRALTETPVALRCRATERVAQCLWANRAPQPWAMALLLGQLQDLDHEVRALALELVRAACRHPAMAACAMAQGPPTELLVADEALALLGAATHEGLRALHRAGLFAPLLQAWHTREALVYVRRAEEVLASAPASARCLPPHLYGQLACTDEGGSHLVELDVPRECVGEVRALASEAHDAARLTRLKAALWALGQIGSSDSGMALLDACGGVQALQDASTSGVVSVRGTCFYVYGLWAQCERGREALAACGWVASVSLARTASCLPKDLAAFVRLDDGPGVTAYNPSAPRLRAATDEREAQAALLLSKLCNGVLGGPARRALARAQLQAADVFARVSLLGRALDMMDRGAVRLATRRQIWAMFPEDLLSLRTASELMHWQATHYAHAPSLPARRTRQGPRAAQATSLPHGKYYDVPTFARPEAPRDEHPGSGPSAASAAPVADAARPPAAGSVPRAAWPLQVKGFV